MAATYRSLHQRAARQAATRVSWRNRVTGAVILALLIFAALRAGSNLGAIPLRKIGTTPDGRPVYAP